MIAPEQNNFDIFIIGGGINGTGIARDAAGRGLKVCLAEMGDLGSATSSASTKLIHGGLRYLEYFEFKLVKESLKEREILLTAMPHICRPMKFILPYNDEMRFDINTPASKFLSIIMPWKKLKREAWVIRLGLLIYDILSKRNILPRSKTINLKSDPTGKPLKKKFVKGFEYSDCWVEDSRLVILNARDADNLGARILSYHEVLSAQKDNKGWLITVKNKRTLEVSNFKCKVLINAGGPWVEKIIQKVIQKNAPCLVRLVKGSHIVTKKLFNHEKSYFFHGEDGRVVFAIPFETDYTLIGTTDISHSDIDKKPQCTLVEKEYLLKSINEYLDISIIKKDIIWSYAGVRPLYEDGAKSETAVSREYFIAFDETNRTSPIINIYGGKLTTYRKLSEATVNKLSIIFPNLEKSWTSKSYLPGGNFNVSSYEKIVKELHKVHHYLDLVLVKRLVRLYGTESIKMLAGKEKKADLGRVFSQTLYAFEIDWGIENEWVKCSDDFLWRRTKLGLQLSENVALSVDKYIRNKLKKNNA